MPESVEIFMIRLLNVSGGACLLRNASEVEVRIKENDPLIRFEDSAVVFTEASTQTISVLRGIGRNGKRVGPIDHEALVKYRTIGKTAISDTDFVNAFGEIVFETGITKKEIKIEIKSDPIPELAEYFIVELYDPSPGIILVINQLNVTISKSDDPHGVISFTKMNFTYIVDEDGAGFVSVSVNRSKGTIGNITVDWEIEAIDGMDPRVYFEQVNGKLIFLDGESFKIVSVKSINDSKPSEAVVFFLSLTNTSGGASLMKMEGGKPKVAVVVADSDNAYGEIHFANNSSDIILVIISPLLHLFKESFFLHNIFLHNYSKMIDP